MFKDVWKMLSGLRVTEDGVERKRKRGGATSGGKKSSATARKGKSYLLRFISAMCAVCLCPFC